MSFSHRSIFTSEEGGSIFPRNVCIYEQLYNGIATQETNMDVIQSRSLGSSGMYHRAVTFKLTDVSEVRTASIIRAPS
jgi:hypothetical protein